MEKQPQTPEPELELELPRVDRAWVLRLREDAQRPLSRNLAEGIALSHVLVRYAHEPRRG